MSEGAVRGDMKLEMAPEKAWLEDFPREAAGSTKISTRPISA